MYLSKIYCFHEGTIEDVFVQVIVSHISVICAVAHGTGAKSAAGTHAAGMGGVSEL